MIEYSNQLTLAGLNKLFNNEINVLCVTDFHQATNYEDIFERIRAMQSSSYTYQGNVVSHIGNSSYQIDHDVERYNRYYDNVEKNYYHLSEIFSPYPTPIDKIQEDLLHLWQPGYAVDAFHDKKMFAGIVRIIHEGSAIHAHQDHVKWSNPAARNTNNIIGQYGVNVFLKVPESGGALLVWDKELSELEFMAMSNNDFCIPVSDLPPPDLIIKPAVGMLVILNARKLHAIEVCDDSERIALSCFLAYRGQDKPLTIWS